LRARLVRLRDGGWRDLNAAAAESFLAAAEAGSGANTILWPRAGLGAIPLVFRPRCRHFARANVRPRRRISETTSE